MGVLEVFGVQIEILGLLLVEAARHQPCCQTEDNAHSQRTSQPCYLQSSLLQEARSNRDEEVSVGVHGRDVLVES